MVNILFEIISETLGLIMMLKKSQLIECPG